MPPIFGLFILGIAVTAVAAICLLPLLIVALKPKWRRQKRVWLGAGMPSMIALLAGFSCAMSNQRESALAEAVERGDAREVRQMLDEGVTADARVAPFDPYGSPYVIHRAIDAKRWDIVRLLVDHGATDAYYGDDTLHEQSAVGLLEAAGRVDLARRLQRRGPPHF